MGPTGGVGQGANTPVAMGTTGLAPSQAHELVNGKKSIIYGTQISAIKVRML